MQYTKYKSERNNPKCVQYWDSVFQKSNFWFDWVLLKAEVHSFLPEVMEEFMCTEKQGLQILWEDYIEATCGEEDTPMWDVSGDFIRILSEYDMAFYLIHLSIGSDIQDGFTEKQGRKRYIEWLKESKKNGVYGKYRVNTKLEIVRK